MWYINTAMHKLMPYDYKTPIQVRNIISKKLDIYFDGGVRNFEGVLTTAWFWSHRGNASLTNCYDETGLECFVNKLHIDGDFAKVEWIDAICVFSELLQLCLDGQCVRLVATIDDLSCTVRFHVNRDGQDWLKSDIEKYTTPVMYRDYNV